MIPEPWPLLLVRIALEIEVGLLNSEVQEIFGAEGSDWRRACEWPGQAEFPKVVRLFELDCCSIPLTAAGCVGIFAVLAAPAYSFVSPGCCKTRMWRQLSSQVAKAQIAKTTAQRFCSKRDCGPSSEEPESGHSNAVQFRSFDVGNGTLPRESREVRHCTKLTLCLEAGAVASDSPSIQLVLSHQKQRAFQPTPRPRRGFSSGHAQTRTARWRRSSERMR